MDAHMRQELDNYITGHYGEDQFRGMEEEMATNGTCPVCGSVVRLDDEGVMAEHFIPVKGWKCEASGLTIDEAGETPAEQSAEQKEEVADESDPDEEDPDEEDPDESEWGDPDDELDPDNEQEED